jgi:hypothetical protein
MKQTAVEWLFQKMTEQGTNPYWDMRFIQAKEIEREQIKDSYNHGQQIPPFEYAEKYYNETYEKK